MTTKEMNFPSFKRERKLPKKGEEEEQEEEVEIDGLFDRFKGE